MSGFKKAVVRTISKGANFFSPYFLQKVSKQQLILPFYHTISDRDCPHIKHLYPVKGVKAFKKDLDFLLTHYEPISYDDFRTLAANKSQPKKPSFLLSFDDGLKEFHEVIAPVLLQKGIPAICFLNSDFIDNKALFYRYKASLIINKVKKYSKLKNKIREQFKLNDELEKTLLSINYREKYILDKIAVFIDIDFDNFLIETKPYLTTVQIQKLITQGFYFGAHSIDHPEYQFIALEEQIRQTQESIDFVSKSFSLKYKTFSFPFTDYNVPAAFFEQIQAKQIADITFGCAGQKQDSIENHFQKNSF